MAPDFINWHTGLDVLGWIYLTMAIIDRMVVVNSRNLEISFFIWFFTDFTSGLLLVSDIIRDLIGWYLVAPVFINWTDGLGQIFLTMATIDRSIVFNSGSINIIYMYLIQFFTDFTVRLFLVTDTIRDLIRWYLVDPVFISWKIIGKDVPSRIFMRGSWSSSLDW